MKKILNSLIFYFFLVPAFSQETDSNTVTATSHFRPCYFNFTPEVSLYYGSNALSHTFLRKMVFGGEITQNDKDRVYNRLKEKNFLNFDFKAGGELQLSRFQTSRHRHTLSIEKRTFIDLTFSKNLFETAMYGNSVQDSVPLDLGKPFINNISYTNIAYQYTFEKGAIETRKGRHLSFIFSVSGGLLLGNNYMHLTTDQFSIFTTALAESITAEADFAFRQSYRRNGVNGYGASLNLFAGIQNFENPKVGWYAYIRTHDFGCIHWNRNSDELQKDVSIQFEGVEINNVFEIPSNLFDDVVDSLKNIVTDSAVNKSFYSFNPASVELVALFMFNPDAKTFFGIQVSGSMSFFSNPYRKLTVTPKIFHTSKAGESFTTISLPLSYSNLYGFGIGAEFAFHKDFKSSTKKSSYSNSLNLTLNISEVGFTSASLYAGLTISYGFSRFQ